MVLALSTIWFATPAQPADLPSPRSSVGGLTTEHLRDPLGIDAPRPRLAWTVSATGRSIRQTAHQILVASSPNRLQRGEADVWDSGKVVSAESFEVPYGGPPLESRTRYFWAVRVWDNHGNVSDWSAPARFETAFLDRAEWSASWIGKDTESGTTPEPLLRREFALPKKVARARVYIAGIGYHKLFVNGERIGDHQLDPGLTDFDRTVLYVTHDVTEDLRRGSNAVGVSLGRGFYAGGGPATACARWCGQPKLRMELHVSYVDGSSSRLLSDETWTVANGPTTRDSVASEDYDARLEQAGWTEPGFDDSGWSAARTVTPPTGELRAQRNEPIKVTGVLRPAAVTQPQPGVMVFDVGVVTAGWARLVVNGAAGTTVTIRYSEKIRDDGTVENQGGQTDTYVLKGGGPETYEPSYSYKGYQYVQVSANPLPKIISFEGLQVHSAVPSAGGFDSSSLLLNRYHAAMRRTILNNLHSVPTDTPVHEKLAYGGDALLYGESAIRNFGMHAFFDKWMADFTDAQRDTGMIPVTVPDGATRTEDDPVWGSAVVLIHRYLWNNYGDVTNLARDYVTMKRFMDYYAAKLEASGYVYDGDTYGDWSGCVVSCSVPPIEQGPPALVAGGGSAFPYLIGTAFLYRSARELAEIARTIGVDADADQLDTLADNIYDAFQARFYNPVTQTYGDVPAGGHDQTSNLLALSFGLAPPEVAEAVAAAISANVASRGDHLNTGATGSKLILPVLTDAGYGEQAFRVATNPTYPGWGHLFLECGASTMWESWTDCSNDLRRGGNPATGSTAPRSLNHAFFGTVDDWLFTHVAGIQPTAPGFRQVRIKPHPVGDLTRASAFQTTPLGRVSTAWTRSAAGRFVLRVEIPVGATAQVFVPTADVDRVTEGGVPARDAVGVTVLEPVDGTAVFEVGSGVYRFRSRL